MKPRVGIGIALACCSCAPDPGPPREQDALAALAKDFIRPMGTVLVVSRPSDCRTDGETDAAIPADLFAALLTANHDAGGVHLPASVRTDDSGQSPRAISAQRREPVVALSRIGIAGNDALACVEVFGVEERAFFVLLRRDGGGRWSVRSELEAWSEGDPMPWERAPEELPDGALYER